MTKLSTILRHAIDTELRDGVNLDNIAHKSNYLCIATAHAVDSLIAAKEELPEDAERILVSHIMHDLHQYDTTTVTVALARSSTDAPHERLAILNNHAEQQQIRYMYADFLAYMLEDEGN